MIQAEQLCKVFDGFRAVDGISLDVPAGSVLAVLGPNGLQSFREGLSDAELDEIISAMNQDYVPQPKDDPFGWIN